ncbi:Inositol transporter 1 [Porphyridium purpureum]|uniref:Inositol transporter 1 n=1 Tax=Porphyridium purpureum TaxID=35688 RepID=A0A5J4YL86_PORPP|nr:Inositol transporter 1 [Porphyridium purpureum]|eukprot:POR9013..scf291_13
MDVTVAGGLCGALFGYDTGIVSAALVQMSPQLALTDAQAERYVAVAVLCAAVGAPLGSWLSSVGGRRKTLLLAAVMFWVTAIVTALASTWRTLFAMRMGIGLAVGIVASVAPVYLAECVSMQERGPVIASYNLYINAGQLGAALVGAAFANNQQSGWRFMLGLAAVPSALLVAQLVFVLPESPLWLRAQAEKHASGGALVAVPESEDSAPSLQPHGWWAQFVAKWVPRDSQTLSALFLGCFLHFVQQGSGINCVMYYTGTIMSRILGFTASTAIWLNAVVASFNSSFAFVGVFVTRRHPRRTVTICSLAGVAASLLLLVYSFYYPARACSKLVSIVGLCAYLACFASGMGPMPWLINSEIYPSGMRHLAGTATSVNWMTNYVVASTFLTSVQRFGPAPVFGAYFCVAVTGLAVLGFALPETKHFSVLHSGSQQQVERWEIRSSESDDEDHDHDERNDE